MDTIGLVMIDKVNLECIIARKSMLTLIKHVRKIIALTLIYGYSGLTTGAPRLRRFLKDSTGSQKRIASV